VLDCLSLLIVHSASSFLPFRPIPVFSLLVPTSESRHHFSLSCTLSSQILRNFLCFSSLFLACPCLCPFHSDKRKMDEFHLPFALVVFLSLFLSVLFLFSPTFRQYPTLSPPPILSSNLPLSFPLSLSSYSSCTLFPHYVNHPSPIFFLHALYLILFLPFPDLCPTWHLI
jgi:hypothetical protein